MLERLSPTGEHREKDMRSRGSELARCTHELVGAHRRSLKGMGEKASDDGGLTPCTIPREGSVRE